jgi:hypothetical protein
LPLCLTTPDISFFKCSGRRPPRHIYNPRKLMFFTRRSGQRIGTRFIYGDWGAIFADNVIASAILDRLLHHSTTIKIKGESYRLKDKKKAGVVAAKLPGKDGA